jgi:hypothetical protein
VGVRELRQNLSVYLERVKAGETMNVTEYGHVVAVLAPLPTGRMSRLERLAGEGRATVPSRSLKELPKPRPAPPGAPSSDGGTARRASVRTAYFDSSSIVKLLHAEPESSALVDYLTDESLEVSTSAVAVVEVTRALRRLRAEEPDAQEALRGFFLIGLDPQIRAEAARIGSSSLRSLDAIHLATARAIGGEDLEFVTYDDRQATAAREQGFRVVQPGRDGGYASSSSST